VTGVQTCALPIFAVVCTVIGLLGPGSASVDQLLGLADVFDGATGLVLTAGLGVVGAAALLVATWRPAPPTQR